MQETIVVLMEGRPMETSSILYHHEIVFHLFEGKILTVLSSDLTKISIE
jgi:hypothetical protein